MLYFRLSCRNDIPISPKIIARNMFWAIKISRTDRRVKKPNTAILNVYMGAIIANNLLLFKDID